MKMRIVDPHAIFTVAELRELFGLRDGSIPREIRKGRLKAHRVCGRYFITGPDVMRWVRGEHVIELVDQEPQVYDLTNGNPKCPEGPEGPEGSGERGGHG